MRAVFPILLIFFGGLAACLMGTKVGRHVTNYIFSCCFPPWTEHVATRMLRLEPMRARRLIRRNWRQRRQILVRAHSDLLVGQDLEEETATTPNGQTYLMLRTRVYNAAADMLAWKNSNNQDESDIVCSICFGPIENGDTVGDLPCHHLFHAECLKSWLTRRAVCPLCQRADVVERRYRHVAGENVGLPLDSDSSHRSEEIHDHEANVFHA